MSESRSISDLSEKEKQDRLDAWERWYEGQKKKVEPTNRRYYLDNDVMQWDDFRKKYKDETRKSFLLFRHAGGAWEQYQIETHRGSTAQAWRYVEGNYRDPDVVEEKEKEDKKIKIKSTYKPGSSVPDVDPYKISRYKINVSPDAGLTPDSKILKPSRRKFNIPKSVIKYAEGSSRPTNTARMSTNRLRKEVNRKPFKKSTYYAS
mgnify:CR=1 FL=1